MLDHGLFVLRIVRWFLSVSYADYDTFETFIFQKSVGHMLIYAGLFNEAEKEFPKAIDLFEKGNDIQYIGIVWSYRALHFLLMARADPRSSTVHRQRQEHAIYSGSSTKNVAP